jgi:hypothetical protein
MERNIGLAVSPHVLPLQPFSDVIYMVPHQIEKSRRLGFGVDRGFFQTFYFYFFTSMISIS